MIGCCILQKWRGEVILQAQDLGTQIFLTYLFTCLLACLFSYLCTYLLTYLLSCLLIYLFTHVFIYLLTGNKILLEKLIIAQMVKKKFPTFYESLWSTALFTRACHWNNMSQLNPVHTSTPRCRRQINLKK